MSRFNEIDQYLDEEDSYTRRPTSRKLRRRSKRFADRLIDPRDLPSDSFAPTYRGSRHEQHWILTYLGPFYESGHIVDVLYQVRGGKEANVYCCRAHPSQGVDFLAAKLYRPRMFRNLRNDGAYREGRELMGQGGQPVRDRRSLAAVKRGTGYGKQVVHASWLNHEYHTLELLHAAGCDVPKPHAMGENVILMDYQGDETRGAPTLGQVRLEQDEAKRLFDQLMGDVEVMLRVGRVHGDLSAYNVLYWEGRISIIDVPQAFDPWNNPNAYALFTRDVERVCQYFDRYGIAHDSSQIAHDLWTTFLPEPGTEIGPLPE